MTYSGPAAGPIGGRPASGFRIGETLQATFEAAGANFVTFFVLGLLLHALPVLALAFLFGSSPLVDEPARALSAAALRFLPSFFVTSATGVLLQAALARGVVTHLSGGRATLRECLQPAVGVFLTLLAISLLWSAGVGVGLVFLLAPGVFLIVIWSVVAPVEVVERTGIFEAFGRSVRLTNNHRWAISLILLVVYLVAFLIQALVGIPVQMLALIGGGANLVWVETAMIHAVGGALGVVFTGAASGAIYYELRRAKEGAAPAELAAVFD